MTRSLLGRISRCEADLKTLADRRAEAELIGTEVLQLFDLLISDYDEPAQRRASAAFCETARVLGAAGDERAERAALDAFDAVIAELDAARRP